MNKFAMIAAVSFAVLSMTGCMTEKTRLIVDGETAEAAAGFTEDEIRASVSAVIQGISRASARYAVDDRRRIVNVKNLKIDTLSRGNDAAYLSETVAQCLKEGLMGYDGPDGKFIIYNERIGASGRVRPEFILDAKLMQRNVRRDNGNFYQEFSLLIQLTDCKDPNSDTYGLEFWQKRFPIRKAVDKNNAMN